MAQVTSSFPPSSPEAILKRLIFERAGTLLGAALCMAVTAAATAAYAYLVGPVLRALFAQGPSSMDSFSGPLSAVSEQIAQLGPAGLGVLVITTAAVKGLSHYGQTMLAATAGQMSLHGLRRDAFRGLLSLSPVTAESRARGELSARFCVDVEAVEGALSGGVVALVRDGLQITALVVLAFLLDPALAVVGLVAFPPAAWLITRLARRLRTHRVQVHGAFGELAEAVDETAAGLEVAQAFRAQGMLLKRFASLSQGLATKTLRALRIKALGSPVNEILAGGALALTLWYARSRIDAGNLSPESFVSFFTALFLLYQPVKGVSAALSAIEAGKAALDRLKPLLDHGARFTDAGTSLAPLRFSTLRLEELRASYPGGPPVLRGITLDLESGEKVALMGESGAGKTTLLRVLLGFLPLQGGTLWLDGQPLTPNPELLGRLFAFVPQEPFLLRGTILENVRLGRPSATDIELARACDLAGVTAFAASLPQGLATQVGRDGAELSVGQRQRVCLARALASGAPILLMDEVQAPLDPKTEQEINEQLASLGTSRTILAVTHRPSTAATMDRVLHLRAGRVES